MEVKEKENEVDEVRGELAKASKKENELKASKIEEDRKIKERVATIEKHKNSIRVYQNKVNCSFSFHYRFCCNHL